MKCGWCAGSIESHPDWELKQCLEKVSEMYKTVSDRVFEIERKINRVPGSIPGDYTWDELVGNE